MGFDLGSLDMKAVKSTVSDAAVGAVEKVAGDKVDKKMIKDTVDTVVDQAANFVEKKVAEKTANTNEKKDDKK